MIRLALCGCLVFQSGFAGCPLFPSKFARAGGGYQSPAEPEARSDTTTRELENDAVPAEGSWRRVRGTAAGAEKGRVAILSTMDFERSDPRLAGLLLQCGTHGIETIIVVVEPFPPQSQPQVKLRTPEEAFESAGSVIPTGAGIRLPSDATNLMAKARRKASELEVTVTASGATMAGVVTMAGLSQALAWLSTECVQK